jgi:hydroxymethylglutaryl-CoA lyase
LRESREDARVALQEVGPRDGLQNESRTLTPEVRSRLIESLVSAGLPRIQIGSFVDARRVPQMAGTDEVWRHVRKQPGVRYSALVLNRRGLESAIAAGIAHVEIYVSASETHSLKNVGASVTDALAEASGMITQALALGMGVTAGVMCAFGCFFEGSVPVERVVEIVTALNADAQVEIGLADTTGMGDPETVRRVLAAVVGFIGIDRIALHLHDTRGFGMANLQAALGLGVRRFDTAVGGLGGCPFIPGAAGNIATERVVETLESGGFSTGVDVGAVRKVAGELVELLGTRSL